MSKHHKHHHHHSEKSSHRHHHSTSVTSVDWKKKRLYHEGEKYVYESYGDGLTPCKWWRIGRHHIAHIVTSAGQNSRLDETLMRQSQKKVLDDEGKIFTAPEESASSDKEDSAPVADEEFKRDKHGRIRFYSVKDKTGKVRFFDLGCIEARGYPGCTAFSFFFGQRALVICEEEKVRRVMLEIARGMSKKALLRAIADLSSCSKS
jgi:hypothetical protein